MSASGRMTLNMRGVRAGLGIIAVVALSAGLGANAATAEGDERNSTTTTADPHYETTTTTRPPDPPEDQQPSGDGSQSSPPSSDPSQPTVPPIGPGGGDGDGDGEGGDSDGDGDGAGGGSGGSDPDEESSTTGGGDNTASSVDGAAPRVVPPGFQQMINSVRRSKANSTTNLLAALQPLQDLGLTQEEAIAQGFGRFPIAGYASFVDDWWFPRFTPTFHLHQGTDIFAAHGTPVRSPVDGVLRQGNGPVGGLAAYVTQPDGTYFYLAHLSAFVEGQTTGQEVKVGEIVGYVGDSGNAQGGAPHVHLQLHPKGGPPVNPKPYLDQFIAEAMEAVPSLIASREVGRPRALLTTGLTRRMTEGRGAFAAPGSPPRSELLWASSASPGGALALAEAEVDAAARGVDWDELARSRQDERLQWAAADRRAQSLLGPLTPGPLAEYLGLPQLPDGEKLPTVMAAPQGDTPGD